MVLPSDDIHRAVTIPDNVDDLGKTLEAPIAEGKPRYAMSGVIGEGGMGTVLLAKDRVIGRHIAMKVMQPGQSHRQDLRRRFWREALVQGQLEHPTIVPVYDVSTVADGSPSFTMKRIHGVTLEHVIDRLRAGDAEVAAVHTRHQLLTAFGSVCLAIEFAHARGVLHRDLKPANVMLGDFGEVYVLDWGLAKLAGEAEEAVAATMDEVAGAQTQLGAVMGTPGYIAPERLTSSQTVDARADVYALGAILFEVLALEPLHVASIAGSSLQASTLRGGDARPSSRAPARNVPPELDAICVKATALHPGDRYASCRQLYDSLTRFLEGDRDLERRREMSKEHATRARAVLARGSKDIDPALRSDAIRELGRALALDPANAGAADTLVNLLTAPPEELPEEAGAMAMEQERGLERIRARTGAIGTALWVLTVPFGIWNGVQSWPVLALSVVLFLTAAVALFRASRKPPPDGASSPHLVVLMSLAIVSTFPMFGPLVVLPGLAGVAAFGFSIAPRRPVRFLPLALCLVTMIGPLGLELAGVVPSSYRFEGGMMCIVPQVLALQRLPTYVILIVVNTVVIVMNAYFGLALGGALTVAHKQMHLQAWQLRQLLPHEARVPVAPR